ncbi:conserved hypothetical protein [Leishmania major strain Friedlin]|uniref:Ankyrin repeat protein n=1 Tax=Leishmania major TaxID=5664 RepID=Q4QJD8_LEIMA|nr:conserved hypothetical protein [Leishmania major strain Friedlin]CAG9568244.1 Ankyrin_repeats-containing_protein [Leishmania major strain Friedlin]CAJ01984.1 conserved hypothetical protein [Leishmania major strain Friedlin]|eukprot:XP_001687541.1 conserved hypothetical protein [Leishmania major strain Friedlin]
MASTLPPEKKQKATKATTGAASQRKGDGGGSGAHVREDPHHTWNQQLMEACLACDAAAVRKLIERGADPVNAREVPPLSYYTGPIIQQLQLQQQTSSQARSHSEPLIIDQLRADQPPRQQSPLSGSSSPPAAAAAVPDSLPPLAAMLLSGLNTPDALEVMKVLIQHGASVNDAFSFSTAPLTAARPGTDVSENESGGSTAYGASANDSGGHRKNTRVSSSDPKGKQSIGKRKASAIGTALTAAAGGCALVGAAVNPPEAPRQEESTIVGSVLHYVVAHGDHAQLLRLLLLAATAVRSAADAPSVSPSLPLPLQQQLATGEPDAEDSTAFLPHLFPVPLPCTLLPAVEAETIVGVMRWQHQQRLGGAADAAGPNGLPPPTAAPRVSQSRKSHTVSNAAATARFYGSAAAAQSTTAVLPAQEARPVSATSLVSPSAAEAVLAALQQVLRQRQTSTGGYHGLPILTSVYPQQQQKENDAELGSGAATGSTAAPVVVAAAAPCNWWSLADLCDVTDAVVTDDLHQRTRLDFDLLDTCGRSAATLALECGDALSVRLLSFYGARVAFAGQVNASHTRLARACTHGDVARVEALLRQGDSITQISADGRYTLVHYAAAQPSVLRTLVEHGLSMEFENAFGESALTSLLRHGTARNDPRYVQTLLTIAAAVRSASTDGATNTATANLVNSIGSTISANAVRFAQLSTAVQRNMILCPPTPITTLMNAGGAASGSAAAHLRLLSNNVSHGTVAQVTASKSSGGNASRPLARQPFLGGCEVGTWWSFLPPTAATADVLDSLLHAGALMQGFVPDEELDLPYVLFSERQTSISACGGGARGFASAADEDDEAEDDDISDGGVEEGGNADGEDDYGYDDDDGSVADAGGYKAIRTPLSATERHDRGRRRQKRFDALPARLPMRLTPLHHAIFDYHPELIRRLLVDYRVDPMHRDSQGATAVHYAALCTHAQSVLELLLSPQALAPNTIGNSKSRLSSNPGPDVITGAASAVVGASFAAAGSSDVRIDLNAIDMAGRTPLFYAAYVGNATAVQRLIRFGGATLLCGKADKDGYTPLHVAVQQRHADIVELLIRHSNQLMSSAAGVGRGQPVDILVELLASTSSGGGSAGRSSRGGTRLSANRRSSSVLAPGSGHHSQSGSHSAGEPSLASFTGIANPELLVNVEAVEGVTHMTALEMAIKAQQQPPQSTFSSASLSEAQELQKGRLLRIVSVLLSEAQASPLRPSGLANGGALLHRAVADGEVEMTELLLSQYTDPNEVDDVNETPLFLALRLAAPASAPQASSAEQKQQHRLRRTSLIRVLLQYGATPYAQSSVHLQTPMHLAASSLADDDEIVQLLFYSTPDAGGSYGAVRRRRQEQQRHQQAPSYAADVMDGDAPGVNYPLGGSTGGSSSARGRHSSSGGGPTAGRKNFERRVRERRAQQQQRRSSPSSSLPGRSASTSPGPRRKPWRAAAAALSESDRGSSVADVDGPADDQALLGNSSFGYREARNRSVASGEQAGADQSLTHTGEELVPDSRAGGDADEDVLQDEHQQFLERLAQWQCADHLLEPEKCWMLTDAQGQTPLHVLCSRSSPALQRMPAVLKLLEDLQAVTRTNSAIAAVAAGVFDGTRDDDHVLSLCWHLSDAQGRTPLHAAAQSGFVEAMEHILKQAPQSALAVDMQGRTPLHACVLMAASPTAATAVTAHAQGDDDDDKVERATRLRRMLSLLRSAVAAAAGNGAAGTANLSLQLQLQGTPLRRAAGDVLPSRSMKTIATMSNAIGSAAAPHSSIQRLVASLVQASSITAQLQRWQQSRHWGCPALAMKGIGSTGAHMRTACGDGLAAAAVAAAPASRDLQPSDGVLTSSGAANEWKTYVQLPDGQGRTALLLAAEVGNVGAARELLRTM